MSISYLNSYHIDVVIILLRLVTSESFSKIHCSVTCGSAMIATFITSKKIRSIIYHATTSCESLNLTNVRFQKLKCLFS